MEASAEVEFQMKRKNLQEAYDNAKMKSELQETQLSEFREELLRVKREKHLLNENLKTEKERSEALTDEKKHISEKVKVLKDKVNLIDAKNEKLTSLSAENEGLKKEIANAQVELKHFRLQLKPQTKAEYKCEECATSVLNYRKLKVHIKNLQYTLGCPVLHTQHQKTMPLWELILYTII